MHNFIKKMKLLCLRKFNSDAMDYVQSTQPTQTTQTNLYTICYRKIRRYISFFITPIILSLLIACGSDPVPPTSISSAAELAAIRTNSDTLSGSYALTGNIDLSDIFSWQPIGDIDAPFTGSFDGSGYTIRGISSSGYEDAGLFGYVENASISNVGVLVGDISSYSSYIASAGGLVGWAFKSRISNSYALVAGDVTSSVLGDINSSSDAGGLVGFTEDSPISNSYVVVEGDVTSSVLGDVDSSSSSAGGLVGRAINNSPISNSYAVVKSNVTSLVLGDMYSYSDAGGLVGLSDDSPISNSYALVAGDVDSSVSGDINSSSAAGGLVGGAINNSPISNSYAVVGGSISSYSSLAGGLVVLPDNSPISNSYYSASRESSEGEFTNTHGTSQTLAQLRGLTATSARWDGTIWNFGTDSDLPMLFDNPLTSPLPPAFLE